MRVRNIFICSGRGVLRLVEDDERVVQRAPAHVGERGDLDRLLLEHAGGAIESEQIVERVVERTQVGVDLLREVAGQEAEAFAGLDRGRVSTMRLTASRSSASTAQATAR
jgi:hypothetical protein